MLPFELTKDTPYLALSGELWSVFYEYFNRNWSCYKGFLLYLELLSWYLFFSYVSATHLMIGYMYIPSTGTLSSNELQCLDHMSGYQFRSPCNSHQASCPITFLCFLSSQGIDVKSMSRIFVGLVKCGAWGCFDEFNRLEEAVLSAVSMQIQVIQDAIKERQKSIQLMGKTVSPVLTLNPLCAKFFQREHKHIFAFYVIPDHTNKTQVVAIPPRVRQGPAYST